MVLVTERAVPVVHNWLNQMFVWSIIEAELVSFNGLGILSYWAKSGWELLKVKTRLPKKCAVPGGWKDMKRLRQGSSLRVGLRDTKIDDRTTWKTWVGSRFTIYEPQQRVALQLRSLEEMTSTSPYLTKELSPSMLRQILCSTVVEPPRFNGILTATIDVQRPIKQAHGKSWMRALYTQSFNMSPIHTKSHEYNTLHIHQR